MARLKVVVETRNGLRTIGGANRHDRACRIAQRYCYDRRASALILVDGAPLERWSFNPSNVGLLTLERLYQSPTT